MVEKKVVSDYDKEFERILTSFKFFNIFGLLSTIAFLVLGAILITIGASLPTGRNIPFHIVGAFVIAASIIRIGVYIWLVNDVQQIQISITHEERILALAIVAILFTGSLVLGSVTVIIWFFYSSLKEKILLLTAPPKNVKIN